VIKTTKNCIQFRKIWKRYFRWNAHYTSAINMVTSEVEGSRRRCDDISKMDPKGLRLRV